METTEKAMEPITMTTSRGTIMLPTIWGVAEARLVKMERVMIGITMPVALALPRAFSSRKPISLHRTPKIRHQTSLLMASWNRPETVTDSSATKTTLARMALGVLSAAGSGGISFLWEASAALEVSRSLAESSPELSFALMRLASLLRQREATG